MYFITEGDRVVPDWLDGDISMTSTGESSPSRTLICAADWRTTSSATLRAPSSDDAVAVTPIVDVPFWLLTDSERDRSVDVMLSPRESTTPCATVSEVNTGTKALDFWLASCDAA